MSLYFLFSLTKSFKITIFSLKKVFVATKSRTCKWRYCIKKVVLKNFVNFAGKHLCRSLFVKKVAGLKPATLLKKRLRLWCFPVNIVKNTYDQLLLDIHRIINLSLKKACKSMHNLFFPKNAVYKCVIMSNLFTKPKCEEGGLK